MKLLIYSDLHLEFGSYFRLPEDTDADALVLAGDIITFRDYDPLARLLEGWNKPVLFVAGNHEYYTQTPMDGEEEAFAEWLKIFSQKSWLLAHKHCARSHLAASAIVVSTPRSSHASIQWFSQRMLRATDLSARVHPLGRVPRISPLSREKDLSSEELKRELRGLSGKALNLSAPASTNWTHRLGRVPGTRLSDTISYLSYGKGLGVPDIMFTFLVTIDFVNALYNIISVMSIFFIKMPQDLRIYGHTHECDDRTLGKARIVSNQLGYPSRRGGFECAGFDERGKEIEV